MNTLESQILCKPCKASAYDRLARWHNGFPPCAAVHLPQGCAGLSSIKLAKGFSLDVVHLGVGQFSLAARVTNTCQWNKGVSHMFLSWHSYICYGCGGDPCGCSCLLQFFVLQKSQPALVTPCNLRAYQILAFSLILKNAFDFQVIIQAATAVGYLGAGDPQPDILHPAVEGLLALSSNKTESIMFSVGEALCFIFGGASAACFGHILSMSKPIHIRHFCYPATRRPMQPKAYGLSAASALCPRHIERACRIWKHYNITMSSTQGLDSLLTRSVFA